MNPISKDLNAYYAGRASTYEEIYAKPERQADLAQLRQRVPELVSGERVLEIACGTGYWTQQLAPAAASVLAIDLSPEMIEIAKSKNLPDAKLQFAVADAFNLQVDDGFTACFVGFWWSHVARQAQAAFLENLRAKLGKDVLLIMIDNTYVEGSSSPIARTDADGNTYQIRTLANGERYEVLKNFPTDSGLRKKLSGALKDIRILRLQHFWMLSGKFK
jgi:SAM-dependent methyltransferase